MVEVIREGVIFESYGSIDNGSGRMITYCLVKHLPDESMLTTGKIYRENRFVMRTGRFSYQNQTLPAYDYGLPDTPENRKALTNSVAKPKQ